MNNWERNGFKDKYEAIAYAINSLNENAEAICKHGINIDGYGETSVIWQNQTLTIRHKIKKK